MNWSNRDASTWVGLHEDEGLVVYGALKEGEPSSFVELQRLRAPLRGLSHAFALRGELDAEWAARPLRLDDRGPARALLVEHPGGQLLEQLAWERPQQLRSILRAALATARALSALHARRLVHGNVTPRSVFVDVPRDRAWLTAFWLTSGRSVAPDAGGVDRVFRASLPYMAPEQTGRLNRAVDARSDLYSFGVVLYELLTGALPLDGLDALDWIHAHVAKPPARFPPAARVPTSVQALVMRLLAKNAEQRYQTAAGVARDLERCLAQVDDHGLIEPFVLAQDDAPDELSFSGRLYGREAQVRVLEEAFARVVSSVGTELLLVSGSAGVGKSSLVQQLRRALPAQRGAWVSGKLELLKRDVPYAALAVALRERLRLALAMSEPALLELRDRLLRRLGAHVGLLAQVLPELPALLGKLPPAPDLPPDATKRRFQALLVALVAALAGPEQPLVLFLDDLQWLDSATLELLELLSVSSELRCVLLVGAYREEEVRDDHPLLASLERMRAAGAVVTEVKLEPLSDVDLTLLLAEALRSGVENAAPLAALVRERTAGNPFFVMQFLSALVDRDLLRYEPNGRAWSYDLESISAQGFTDNVVDLMLERLRRLPMPTRATLSLLSCVGDRATAAQLSVASGEDAAALRAQLERATEWGALRLEDDQYAFSHDRIREACYALLSEAERVARHLEIGRHLARDLDDVGPPQRVFDVVDQLARAAPLLNAPAEREATARLALTAGRLARANAAPTAALGYFEAGLRLLDANSWRDYYEPSFGLSLGQVEGTLAAGDVERTLELLAELLPRARGRLDIAAVRRTYVVAYVMRSDYARAVQWALEALVPFGIHMQARPTPAEVDLAYGEVRALLADTSVETLVDLPLTRDPEVSAPMSVLAELFAPACFTDEGLAFLHLCRMVRLTLERGVTDASAHAFAWFGVMLGHVFGEHAEGARFVSVARQLVERHRLVAYEAKTLFSTEIVRLWTAPLSHAIEAIRAAFKSGLETGDLPVACFACHHVVSDRLVRGDALDEVFHETEVALTFVRRAGYRDVIDEIVTHQRYVEALRGRTAALHSFSGEAFDASAFEAALTPDRMPTMSFWYWVLKAQAQFLGERFEEAWWTLERARALCWSSPVHIQYASYHLFRLLTIAALDGAVIDGSSSAARREQAQEHREKLALWAATNPATFGDKLLLADAELARLEGREQDAARLYESAAGAARERGFVQQEALAHELAARFYEARRFDTPAAGCWLAARACYARWGAHGKLRQLEARGLRGLDGSFATPVKHLEELDFENVIRALQQVSREMVLERLVDTLMRAGLQTAGADRGVLILLQDGEPSLTTEAELVDGRVNLTLRERPDGAAPSALLRYVLRAKEPFIVSDTSAPGSLPDDPYFEQRRPLSLSCLPLTTQGRTSGVLYLENGLTSDSLTPRRVRELELLASQAAISLENARLYRDLLRENAERLRAEQLLGGEKRLLEMVATGSPRAATLEALCTLLEEILPGVTCAILVLDAKTGLLRLGAAPHWPGRRSEAGDLYAGNDLYGPNAVVLEERRPLVLRDLSEDPRWPTFRARVREAGFGACWSWPITSGERALGTLTLYAGAPSTPAPEQVRAVEQLMHVASIAIERTRVETTLHQLRSELAHVGRVATLGELTASIAHEVNQPLAGIVMNGRASLRWLDRQPPDLGEARQATLRLLRDATRASETIGRLRDLFRKGHVAKAPLDLEDLLGEVLLIAQHEVARHAASVVASVASDATHAVGDRVQLQQVLINLILNGLEAMSYVEDRPRELRISVAHSADDLVEVSVADSGMGAGLDGIAGLFEPFVTSKPGGMGMGLSISRSIVEDHGGKIWAEPGEPYGMIFRFTLPRGS